jgi:hypothetical protein
VKAGSLAFGVKLTEVEQKLKSVVTDLEVVGITPFGFPVILGASFS